MRLLITGAAGLIGGALARSLARNHHVVAGWHRAAPPAGLENLAGDWLESRAAERALDAVRPDAVVHLAALADPDLCEREPGRATRLNLGASEAFALACARRDVKLVFFSTDLVFGDADERHESAVPHPTSAYGKTKLAAEQASLAASPRHAVARVALVVGRGYGPRGTASETIAWALHAGRPLHLYSDQWRTPIDPASIAEGCDRILAKDAAGVFHFGGLERISRYELGLRVAGLLGRPASGIAATTHEVQRPAAPRPKDASLDARETRRALGWQPRGLDAAIRDGRPTPDSATNAGQ